jgi:hypothetical protein
MGLAWTAVMLVLALVSLSGWLLAHLGDNCVLIQTANAPCWFYASQLHWSLDFIYVVLALLCLANYLHPHFLGRKKARDAIIGVLFLDSFLSIGRVFLNSDIDIAGGYILGVALNAAINLFFFIVPFVLAIRVIRERTQTFSTWLSGVFKTTNDT